MQKKFWILSFVLCILPILRSLSTQNPPETSFTGDFVPLSQIEFISDRTYQKDTLPIYDTNIFQTQLAIIEDAQQFILLDQFLFNDAYDRAKFSYPSQVDAITQALIAKKQQNPSIEIIFITDPINDFYGAYREKHLQLLEENGILTIITDLNQLKDSNPLYSGYYRTFFQWFGSGKKGWIQNPIAKDAPNVTLRSILKLLNFKANHRKILLTEREALISSANPHDPSAYHSNVALRCSGEIQKQILASEKNVASFSGVDFTEPAFSIKKAPPSDTQGDY